jgi:hypothetical protein
MHDLFWECLDKFVIIYLDDIIIYSDTEEDHLSHLQTVFEIIKQNELYIHPDKCEFLVEQVEFLGHVITPNGIAMDSKKIQAIVEWPVLQSKQDILRFLGLAGYYRRFINMYSDIAAPLTELLKKKKPFEWAIPQQTAFNRIKEAIASEPIVRLPNPELEFTVTTDASDTAVGAVLTQRFPDTNFDHPIAFHSRKMKESELNYPPWAKELLAIVDALRTWRVYLDGQKFKIVTDHQALVHFNTQPKMSRHQARWLELMQEFDYELIYKPGTTNRVADPLSRPPAVEVNVISVMNLPQTLVDKYKASYQNDKYYQHLYQFLINKEKDTSIETPKELLPKAKHFQLRDSLLYFTVHGLDYSRLVVPDDKELRYMILHDNHDTVISGHLGYDKTYELIQREYYWLNMTKDIQEYVFTCDQCQRNKSSNHKSYGLLKSLPIPERNWEQIAIDFIVRLPKTSDGYDAIMVCIDRLSKMAHFIPGHTTDDAKTVSKLYLEHVFRLHGLPKVIVSDRDSRFTGHFWKNLHQLLGTKLAMSTAYHPQTDGQTERTNRTLEQMLRAFVNYRQDNWKELLPLIEFAYNNSHQATTKRTPFEVNYGFHPHRPGPQLLTACPASNEFKLSIDNLLKEAQDQIARGQISQAEYANRSRTSPPFKLHDKVLVIADHILQDYDKERPTRKLGNKKLGPFEIIRVVSDVAYKLNLPSNLHINPVFHASQLERYLSNSKDYPQRQHSRPVSLEISDKSDSEYEVEKILDKRKRRNRIEYLVNWKNYPDYESTWEPEGHLKNARHKIKLYEQKQRK